MINKKHGLVDNVGLVVSGICFGTLLVGGILKWSIFPMEVRIVYIFGIVAIFVLVILLTLKNTNNTIQKE